MGLLLALPCRLLTVGDLLHLVFGKAKTFGKARTVLLHTELADMEVELSSLCVNAWPSGAL